MAAKKKPTTKSKIITPVFKTVRTLHQQYTISHEKQINYLFTKGYTIVASGEYGERLPGGETHVVMWTHLIKE